MGAEQVHTLGAFEDGRDLSSAGGGLDGQDRPQACLFCRPYRSTSLPFLYFHDLPVQLPPIQAVLCAGPKFSQRYVAAWLRQLGCWMINYTRLLDDKLHQQQPTHGQHKGGSQADGRACSDSTGTTWFHSKLCQVLIRSVQ